MSRTVSVLLVLSAACVVATIGLSRPFAPKRGAGPPRATSRQPSHSTSVPPVRVLITGALGQAPRLRIDGPYRVLRPGDWRVLAQGQRLESAQVAATETGLAIGAEQFAAERLRIEVIQPASLWIDGRRYRGEVWISRRDAQRVRLINHVALEDYVASVVACEIPASFPVEARVAQAVAARTFALYQMKTRGPHSHYDLGDDQRAQVYRGVVERRPDGTLWEVESQVSRAAAQVSSGVVLTYQQRLFCSYYSAVCGGETVEGRSVFADAAPPLVNVPCTFCEDAQHYRWEVTRPAAEVYQQVGTALAQQGQSIGVVTALAVRSGGPGESLVEVTGENGRRELSPGELRRAVGHGEFPSARFRVTAHATELKFRGRGFGHGVGLCQWGARGQAVAGRSAAQILAHYYPGCALLRIE